MVLIDTRYDDVETRLLYRVNYGFIPRIINISIYIYISIVL